MWVLLKLSFKVEKELSTLIELLENAKKGDKTSLEHLRLEEGILYNPKYIRPGCKQRASEKRPKQLALLCSMLTA